MIMKPTQHCFFFLVILAFAAAHHSAPDYVIYPENTERRPQQHDMWQVMQQDPDPSPYIYGSSGSGRVRQEVTFPYRPFGWPRNGWRCRKECKRSIVQERLTLYDEPEVTVTTEIVFDYEQRSGGWYCRGRCRKTERFHFLTPDSDPYFFD